MAKIVLAGPPRSGKSCLREGLKQAIRRVPGAPYPYVVTACPDGEGSWFQETADRDPRLAARLKAAYKAKFTSGFVDRVSASVRTCALPLTLVDIGGIASPENRAICAPATHAVILFGRPATREEWRQFCREVGLEVIAEIYSAYLGTEDHVRGICPDGVLRGSIHYLERGVDVSRRPMAEALAERVADLVRVGE